MQSEPTTSSHQPFLVINPSIVTLRQSADADDAALRHRTSAAAEVQSASPSSLCSGSAEVSLAPHVDIGVAVRVLVKTNLPSLLRLSNGTSSSFTIRKGETQLVSVRFKHGRPPPNGETLRLLLHCEPSFEDEGVGEERSGGVALGKTSSGTSSHPSTWKGRNFDMLNSFSLVVPVILEERSEQREAAERRTLKLAIEEGEVQLQRVQAECDELLVQIDQKRAELDRALGKKQSLPARVWDFLESIIWMEVLGSLLVLSSTVLLAISL